MRVVNRGTRAKPEYWIVGTPVYEADGESHNSYGPYTAETKDEVQQIANGVEKSLGRVQYHADIGE